MTPEERAEKACREMWASLHNGLDEVTMTRVGMAAKNTIAQVIREAQAPLLIALSDIRNLTGDQAILGIIDRALEQP